MWLTVAITVVAVYVIVCVWASRARADRGPRPPEYPGAWPLIGHGHLFASGDSVAFWELAREISFYGASRGGVISFRTGPKQIYLVSDPDDCVTLANAALEKDFVYDFIKPALGEGLLTASVPIWKVHRRLLTPAFSQGVLDGFIGVFNSQAKRLVASVDKDAGKEPLDFWTHIGPNALETICLTAMGGAKAGNLLSNDYMRATETIYNIIIQRFLKFWLHNNFIFNLSSLGKKLTKNVKIVNDVTDEVLQKKKKELKKDIAKVGDNNNESGKKFKAFIDLILECSGDKRSLTDQEIRDEVDTIIVAGHDTSASTTVYALLLLGSHPDVQDRVYKEITEVLGDRDVEKQDLPKLEWLEAVLKETLRLYPIAPFVGRKLTENVKLKNYTLPAGSHVFLAFYVLHRDKQMWGADAEQFRPERWLDKTRLPDHQAAFAAFSLGRRMCIGKNYALMGMKTSLAHLLRSFRFRADVSRLRLKLDIMLRPHAGHHIAVERRT